LSGRTPTRLLVAVCSSHISLVAQLISRCFALAGGSGHWHSPARSPGGPNVLLWQLIVLALVQGITEFLPISSSGHLILVPVLTGWQDQGLLVDVMAHVGSLAAIIAYFWRDVLNLMGGGLDLLRGRLTHPARMVLYIAAATVPAVVPGLIRKTTGFLDAIRGPHIVAW